MAMLQHIGIIKNWDRPDILRQTPGGKIWDEYRFSVDTMEACDLRMVLYNWQEHPYTATIRGRSPCALRQELYAKEGTGWMAVKQDILVNGFSQYRPDRPQKHITSHSASPWSIHFSFDKASALKIPGKKRTLTWTVGNAEDLPGRIRCCRLLQAFGRNRSMDIDLFERTVRFIECKNERLLPYPDSLAIEHTRSDDDWTEKSADFVLAWTVPIYFSWPNLASVFYPLIPSKGNVDETILAGDGSNAETVDRLNKRVPRNPFPAIRVWQPKNGSRLAAVWNNGVRHAAGNYLICPDCDFFGIDRHQPAAFGSICKKTIFYQATSDHYPKIIPTDPLKKESVGSIWGKYTMKFQKAT